MSGTRNPAAAIGQALRLLGGDQRETDVRIRQAAWVARCVGRGEAAPLGPADLTALATTLQTQTVARDTVVFTGGQQPAGVWIVREGQVELSVGSGRRRLVVHVLRPGDVDGDIPLLLDMPLAYTARALSDTVCLFLSRNDFERLLATRPSIARRWLSSVAQRLATSQARILGLLGRSLTEQVARLLLDEAVDGTVPLPQRTLAAMLGAQRLSLNKILKDLERDRLIGVRYGAIDILDSETLSTRAG
jgi:CRP-like cAMP-binding protein